jgi:hypothetical protein
MAMRSMAAKTQTSVIERMQRWTGWMLRSGLVLIAPALACGQTVDHQPASATPGVKAAVSAADQRKLESNYLRSPLSFEPNQGQTDKRVQYISHGAGYSLFLAPSHAVLSLQSPVGRRGKGTQPLVKAAALEMVTVKGNKLAPVSGLDAAASRSNYFIGNDHEKWHANVPNFARVKYTGIYPGIDLTYYGNQSQLEYDFVVSPGADPRAIKLQFKGMKSLHLDPRGELLIDTAAGRVRLEQPIVYQATAGGSREPIEGRFVLAHDQVRFQIGAYDKSRSLVIDPIIALSSYLGGSGEENYTLGHIGNYVSGIAIDPLGAAYITGITTSTTNFPMVGTDDAKTPLVTNAVYTFVAKFSPSGSLVYSTFLGGSTFYPYTSYAAVPGGIAVDSGSNAYVAGYTTTIDYPTYQLSFEPSPYINNATGVMGFVTKLDATGILSSYGYSTYVYGEIQQVNDDGTDTNGVGGYTYLNAIAVDAAGHAYVTGAFGPWMPSAPNSAPSFQNQIDVTVGNEDVVNVGDTYSVHDAAYNAGVFELDQYGSNELYFSYIGGAVNDVGTGIAVDAGGVYITGWTDSKNFPVTAPGNNVIQSAPNAVRQAFVAKIKPSLPYNAQLVYSTYLGGTGGTVNGVVTGDEGHAIAIDSTGDAYVTGSTASTDFPTNSTNPPLQTTLSGGSGDIDAFVVKLNPTGTPPLIFSTYLGGGLADSGQGIAVDPLSNIYVTGYTYSLPSNLPSALFPTLSGSLPVSHNLGSSFVTGAFLTEYTADNSSMIQSTLFASPSSAGSIVGTAVAVDMYGNAYITGETKATDMPTTHGAPQTALHGSSDAFLAKIWPITITDSDNLIPAAVNFGDVSLGTTSALHYLHVTSYEIDGMTVTASPMQGTNPGSFALSDGCTGSLGAAGASCGMTISFTPVNGGQYLAYFTLTFTDHEGVSQVVTIPVTGNGAGLIVSPNPIVFPSTLIGATSQVYVSVNAPGTAAVTITGMSIPDAEFGIAPGSSCTPPVTLSNGGGCEFHATFTPTSVNGVSTSTLTFTSVIGGVTSTQPVQLSGQGTGLVLSPNPAVFTSAEVGNTTSSVVKITATNNSSSALTIASWSLPSGAAFYVSPIGNTCSQPVVLAANSSCFVYLFFAPTSAAEFTSTFTVNALVNGVPSAPSVALSGQGLAPLASINPIALSFPNVAVGTSSLVAQTLVTNTGGLPLDIVGFSVPAASGGFSVAPLGAGTTCTQPVTLAAQTSTTDGGSCYIGVIFSPTSSGVAASTLTLYDNSGGSSGAKQTVALQGSTAQVTLSPVTLTFPNTVVGTSSAAMTATLTNQSASTLTLASVRIIPNSGYALNASGTTCTGGLVLAANNGTCVLSVVFTPTTATGATSATLIVTDNADEIAGSTQSVALTGQGTAPAATLTPSSLTFTANVGASSPSQQVTLTNSGTAVLTLASNAITLTGTNASSFQVVTSTSSTDCSKVTSVAIGGNCTLSVVFNATSITPAGAVLSIVDNSGGTTGATQTVMLSGNGTGSQVVVSPTGLTFPATPVSQTSASESITVKNTGNAALTLGTFAIPANSGFNLSAAGTTCSPGAVLAANTGSCTIVATFTPITAAGLTQSTLTLTDSASTSPQAVSLSGQGEAPQAVLTPAPALSFSAVVGSSTSQTFTLSNPGNYQLSVSGIFITGPSAAVFSTPGPYGSTACETTTTVAAGSSCTISVTFAPTSLGSATAILSVTDGASSTSPQQLSLNGNGMAIPAPGVSLSANALTFSTPVGTTSAGQTVTLTNTGNATLENISVGVTGADPGGFTQSNTCGTSVAAGSKCMLSVSFTASSITSVTAAITITDNATGSPQSITLNGTGSTFTLAAPTLTQSVQPGANAQFNITATSSGGPFNNPVVLTATGLPTGAIVSFAPASVTPGSTTATSMMSIQTPSLMAAQRSTTKPHGGGSMPLLATAFGLPLLALLGWRRKHHASMRPLTLLVFAAVTLMPFLIMMGCGGGYFADVPHTSVVTITGTSGAIQQSTTVTLTVQ